MTGAAALLRRSGVTGRGDPYLIRPAHEVDAAALVALHDAVAAERVHLASLPGDRGLVEEALALAGTLNSGGLALTLEVGGAVAGSLGVQRFQSRYSRHIGEVAIIVAKEHRGAGLGRALMVTAIDWARAVGLTRLTLGVFPGNAAAVGLYRSLGFVEEGLRRHQVLMPDGYRDVLAMSLLLEPGPERPP